MSEPTRLFECDYHDESPCSDYPVTVIGIGPVNYWLACSAHHPNLVAEARAYLAAHPDEEIDEESRERWAAMTAAVDGAPLAGAGL